MLRRLVLLASAVILLVAIGLGATAYWLLSGDGVRRAIEAQAAAWLGQPVRIGGASARLFPRLAIHLSDVRVGEPVRLALASVDLSAPTRALLARRIENAEVAIARSRIDMPLPFAMPAIGGAASPATRGNARPLVRLMSVAAIALRDVTIASRGRELTVDADAAFTTGTLVDGNGAAVSPVNGPLLTVTRLSIASGATSLRANGIIALEPRVDVQARVAADTLDLDDLLALANAFSPPPAGTASSRPPVRIAARISAGRVRAAGAEGHDFACELQVRGADVTLSPLSVTLFGGHYQGSLTARLGERLAVTLRARVTDLDVAQLAAFGGVQGSITGRLSGAGTFNGSGADVGAVLRSARGAGTASIVDGTIAHLNLVRTAIVFFGRPAPEQVTPTDHFDRLDAQFSLAQQLLRGEPIALHSQDADVVGEASLALDTTALDGRLDVSLSEALSKEAGTDLYRYTREGNRVVLPATLGGTLAAPRIGIDASAAVRRGLRNEMQRRLGDLLDRFRRQPADEPPAPDAR